MNLHPWRADKTLLSMNNNVIYFVGFTAQILFASRLLIQWVKSERAGRVLSPTLFWLLSLIAAFLMIIYGILRKDFVILLGQALCYFIYIRNLQFKNAWSRVPFYFKAVVLAFPLLALGWLLFGSTHNLVQIFTNEDITGFMMIWGSFGQLVFTFRFVYQWYYSEKLKISKLPVGFWLISIAGSSIILSYAIYRKDPVLFIGQLFGSVIYIRNTFLHFKPTRTITN